MSEERLPRKAYDSLFDLDLKGKQTWASEVKSCLYRFGFGFVWECQGVGDVKGFLNVFKQRLIDCRWQDWHTHVNESNRFSGYRNFCTLIDKLPKYLCLDMNKQLKFCTTKLLFGISDLSVHVLRYQNVTPQAVLCPLCHLGVENELHFLLCCPFFDNLRQKFIPLKYYRFSAN